MKKIIFCFIISTIAGCTSSDKKLKPEMPGAYLMTSQTLNNGTKDEKYTSLKQLKIYTDKFVMYTQVNPDDSVSSFGVGSYTADTGAVIENIVFSAKDTAYSAAPASFTLQVTNNPDGYEQIIPDLRVGSQPYKLTEQYQVVGKNVKTPLDGVWKQTSANHVAGKDITTIHQTEYKAFYSGYFMFGVTTMDSATNKSHTGIGFGTFEVNGNSMKETDLNSTYSIIAGQTFSVGISMNGQDGYTQTIVSPDGSKNIESYERMK